MTTSLASLRDKIIVAAMPIAAEEGWTWSVIERAAKAAHVQDGLEKTIFVNGLVDAVAHFSGYADRKMLESVKKLPESGLRTKDKIRAAVLARYHLLAPHKGAVKSAMAFWAMPHHVLQGQRVLWHTADTIWNWAGDTATDYNRQTKRALLSTILMGTTMVWITDDTDDAIITQAFLDRRLENIMEFGKVIGTMKQVIPNLFRQAKQTK